MSSQESAFEKCPQAWIEERDIEGISFEKATWIPLIVAKVEILRGQFGKVGHRKAYRNVDSIIVPLNLQAEFAKVDWQSVTRHNPDCAWADEKRFIPPGCYGEDPRVLYPVIQRSFETGEPEQWDLLQELEVGLGLYRRGNTWIQPDENDVEVAKLERDAEGKPVALLFRAEHLRDYLCAKKASLLLTIFSFRDAVEESFPELKWNSAQQERQFAHGEWEGTHADIHEGGEFDRLAGGDSIERHAWQVREFFYTPDARGRTCAERWADAGFPGLRNDERVIQRAAMQLRPRLIEVHRVLDDLRIEAVALLEAQPRPFLICDRALAARACRFTALLG